MKKAYNIQPSKVVDINHLCDSQKAIKIMGGKYFKKIILSITLLMILIGCDDFFEKNISDDIVVLIAPSSGVETTNQRINFSWLAVEGATSYFFEVATPSFSKPFELVVDSVLTLTDSTNVATKVTIVLPPGTYGWRVKAANSGYETTYSDAHTLFINDEEELVE